MLSINKEFDSWKGQHKVEKEVIRRRGEEGREKGNEKGNKNEYKRVMDYLEGGRTTCGNKSSHNRKFLNLI